MIGLNWISYVEQPAPRTLLCQFRRQDGKYLWDFVGYAKDFLPEFNVAGLEWKLTGIAREELDQMPEAVREQVFAMSGGFLRGVFWATGYAASAQQEPGSWVGFDRVATR